MIMTVGNARGPVRYPAWAGWRLCWQRHGTVPMIRGRQVRRSTRGAMCLGMIAMMLALALPPVPLARAADDDHQGLQGGWAVDDRGNVNFVSSFSLHNAAMHEAEAGWVRLNFRLGGCFRDWTSVGCN